MTDYVLDYSAGRLTAAQVRAYAGKPEKDARYVGAVRYAGSAGQQGKEATKAELDSYVSNGLGVALVYETTAGWWRGGRQAGIDAAHAIFADATAWGYAGKIRGYFFTADEDVTPATLATFKATISGAASVLGFGVTGAYGEADVIDACVGGKLCRWGWQTRAWSGGRVSEHAHILQLVGYVYPGSFNADRSLVLKPDWGQYPAPTEVDEVTFEEVWTEKTIPNPAWAKDKLASVGQGTVKTAYTPAEILAGLGANMGYMIGLTEKRAAEDRARDAAHTAALSAMADAVKAAAAQQGQDIDVDALVSKIGERIESAVLNVRVTVDDNTKGDTTDDGTVSGTA
jgi:hypothetical protein